MKTYIEKQAGFTLLELMIVLTISAILLAVAIPSMTGTTKGAAVRSHHRDFQSALMFARGEAVSRNKQVSICPTDKANNNSPSCDTANDDWSNGWLVFIDDGDGSSFGNGRYNSGKGEQLLRVYDHDGGTILKVRDPDDALSDLDSISWNFRGFTEDGQRALAIICDKDQESFYTRGLMIERSGRVIHTRDSDGDGVHESVFEDDNGVATKANLGCG